MKMGALANVKTDLNSLVIFAQVAESNSFVRAAAIGNARING
jgi:hypothetical protein